MAIRVGASGWPKDAIVGKLFDEAVGPVASAPFLRGRKIKSPADLLALPLLHTRTRRHAWPDWAARIGWEAGVLPGREFEHFYFMLEAAVSGLGIAIAPWQLVSNDIAAGRLIAPFGFVPSGQAYVALRRRRRDKKAEAFQQWLIEEAATLPPAGRRLGTNSSLPQEFGAAATALHRSASFLFVSARSEGDISSCCAMISRAGFTPLAPISPPSDM